MRYTRYESFVGISGADVGVEKSVIICHRRKNRVLAQAVDQILRADGYDVFYDSGLTITPDTEQVHLNQITARAHFILILTPNAINANTNRDDWFRRQIEFALDFRRNIIVLCFYGAELNDMKPHLYGKLSLLLRSKTYAIVEGEYAKTLAQVQQDILEQPTAVILYPTPSADRDTVSQQVSVAERAPQFNGGDSTPISFASRRISSSPEVPRRPDFLPEEPTRSVPVVSADSQVVEPEEETRPMPNESVELESTPTPNLQADAIKDREDMLTLTDYFMPELTAEDTMISVAIQTDSALDMTDYMIEESVSNVVIGEPDVEIRLDWLDQADDSARQSGVQNQSQSIENTSVVSPARQRSAARLLQIASASLDIGEYQKAINTFDAVLRIDPNLVDAYYLRGVARQYRNDLWGASVDFERALAIDPNHIASQTSLKTVQKLLDDRSDDS